MANLLTKQSIPKGWRTADLADIADIVMGQSPASTSYNQSGEGLPFFQGKADFTKSYRTIVRYWTTAPTKLSEPGDVLLSVRAPVGDVALNDVKACIGRGLAAIRAKGNVSDQDFIFQLFLSLKDIFNTKAQGSTFTAINGPALRQIPVALPPLSEQRKIAKILSAVDEEIQKTEEIIIAAEKLKKGTMRQLFSHGINHTKFKKTKLGSIPESWEVVTLGDIGTNTIGLTYSPKDVVQDDGTLVFRSSNIKGNTIDYGDRVFVNKRIPTNLITKPGDILLCTRNGSRNLIGKNAYIDQKSAGHSFGAFMSVYRTKYSGFVFQLFQSEFFKKQVNQHLSATINQITTGVLNTFLFALPPVDEQKKIVDILSSVDEKIAVNRQIKTKMVLLKKGIMRDLLSGEKRTI